MTQQENQESGSFQKDNKKSYLRYTREMRLQLIKLVDQDNLSTAEAARKIGIKQTSACRIMKSYHSCHRIFERKDDRLLRQGGKKIEEHQNSIKLQNIKYHPEKKLDNKQKNHQSEDKKREQVVNIPAEHRNQNISAENSFKMIMYDSTMPTPVYCLGANNQLLYFPRAWGLPFFYQ